MWEVKALASIKNGEQVHPFIATELLERGLAKFADHPKEMVLTETGQNVLERAKSADAHSKRY